MNVNASGAGMAIGKVECGGQVAASFHAAPRPAVIWPHLVGVLPRQADHFQERAAVAAQLKLEAAPEGTAGPCQVLSGMGGVGKTQLAAHHARTLWQTGQLDLLVWITASTRTAVLSGYAEAAADILHADPADPDRAARAFLAWLEPRPANRQRWMVVLDDLVDPADLRGLWPSASPHGHTLVTTRRRDQALLGMGRRLVPVSLFDGQESADYLATTLAAHNRHEPADQLTCLAADLGHLPLALSQAAAYLVDTELDCATYRDRLADRARVLADLLPDDSSLPDDQATTVAAAWSLSVDRADQLRPVGLARPMLRLAAMLDPNGIPTSVLTNPWALDYLVKQRARLAGPQDAAQEDPEEDQLPLSLSFLCRNPEDALGALHVLHRLSLVDRTGTTEHQRIRIHQLIQRTTRDGLSTAELDEVARTAADALWWEWEQGEKSDTALTSALHANTRALITHAEDALYRPDVHPVLFQVGYSLGEAGQVTAARDFFQSLATTACLRLGPDHRDTLTARGDLARWQGKAGDLTGAASAMSGLLPDLVRVLGETDCTTLEARVDLARWRGEAGDPAGAADDLHCLLPHLVRVPGANDSYIFTVRQDLVRWRREAGDPAGAADAIAGLLPHLVQQCGEDSPDTLNARNNLAYWRGEAGDPAGAAADLHCLVPHLVRVLGEDHPTTLTVRYTAAHWYKKAGDPAGAAAALSDLLPQLVRVLGADHPNTLTTRVSLVCWWEEAENPDQAATAFTDLYNEPIAENALCTVLFHLFRVLGADHPNTLTIRARFALTLWGDPGRDQGPAWAATAFADLVDDLVRVLGNDHPATFFARHGLARWQGAAGDPDRAAATLADLLDDLVRVLGEDHHVTNFIRTQLARWQGHGERTEAPGIAAIEANLRNGMQGSPDAQVELSGGTATGAVSEPGEGTASRSSSAGAKGT